MALADSRIEERFSRRLIEEENSAIGKKLLGRKIYSRTMCRRLCAEFDLFYCSWMIELQYSGGQARKRGQRGQAGRSFHSLMINYKKFKIMLFLCFLRLILKVSKM